jgi:hypothetical protein
LPVSQVAREVVTASKRLHGARDHKYGKRMGEMTRSRRLWDLPLLGGTAP